MADTTGATTDAVCSAPHTRDYVVYQLVWIDAEGVTEATFDDVWILSMVIDGRPDFPCHQLLKFHWIDERSIIGLPICQRPMLVSTIAEVLSS